MLTVIIIYYYHPKFLICFADVGGTIPILKYRDLSLGGTKRTNAEAVFSFRQVGWFEGVTPNSLC